MIKRTTVAGSILGIVLLSQTAQAQVIAGGMAANDGDPNAGKAKSELCHGCHGADGMSVDPSSFPNLAGQYAGYIFKQLQDFQLGNRQDDTMSAMAAMVTSKDDLKDIAAYFQSLSKMKGQPHDTELAKKGWEVYKKGNAKNGIYGCVNCHGSNGKGKGADNALFPVIGGQSKAYLVKQLTALKNGSRANDPAGMMADIAKKLTDEEIQAVAEYLSGL